MYKPDSTQQAARFNLAPFQRIELQLDTTKLFQGQTFPEIEGDQIFVERCDYPFVLSLTSQTANYRQAFVTREGDAIRGEFKGLTVSGPAGITFTTAFPPKLVLWISKGCADYSNELAHVQTRFGAATRSITASAVQQTHGIHVPDGVRQLQLLEVAIAWTTLTSAPRITAQDRGAIANVSGNLSLTANGQSYNGALVQGVLSYNPGAVATSGVFSIANFPILDQSVELDLDWQGSGLAVFQTLRCVWA